MNLRHAQLIVILGIALLFIVAFPVAAANISGLKYDDFNQNGHYDPIIDIDPDDQEVGLPGWNISVYNQSNGALVTYQLTDSQGNYLFTGLDGDSVYIVKEDLASHSDWYNSTPTEIIADFKNTTVYPNESLVDGAIASQILPGQNTAFAVRSLWGSNGNYHQDIEWNPFSSSIPSPLNSTRSSLNPHWLNNTEYDFILTYDPSAADPNATINYTVTGPLTRGVTTTTITGKANTSGSRLPIDEIDVYTRANTGASPTKAEVYGITLSTLSGSPFSIGNSSIAISSVAPAQTHLMLRADRILSAQINNGFILKGKQKFSYPIPTPTLSSAGFAVQINVGKNNRSPLDVLEEFGNYQHVGEIEGYKFNDENNNGIWDIALNESVLSGWTIQLTNSTPGFLQTAVTDDEGEYEFYLQYGTYHVEEVQQAGYIQTRGTGGYDVTISDGNNHFFRNFGNYKIPVYNITGYKWNDLNGNGIRDPGEPGLANWTIGLGNATIPYYATNITDSAGNYSFINVPKGIFILNETLQPGWKNTTPLTQTACTPPFPYLPPPGVPGTSVEVFYQSGGTPVPVGDYAYFRTEISGVNPTPGYDVENKLYPGWCADSANTINPSVLYGTCCFHDTAPPFRPELSAKYPAILTAQWDKVNYVLNKRPYYYGLWGAQNTSNVVQAVIWNLTNGVPLTTSTGGITLSTNQRAGALQILADANANGTGYSPTCGGVKGILVNVTGSPTRQLTMVEVPVRCCGSTNFGNQQAIGNISGYKLLQPGNTGLGCWTINLYYGNGTFVQSNITNDTGYFRFDPVPGGNYILNETLQSGWSQVLPAGGSYAIQVNFTNQSIVNMNFTNSQQLGNLSGYKLDTGNNGLENWSITLANTTRSFFNTTLTNSTGGFNFTNIPFGIYQLSEIPQVGWTQVTANQTVEINATSLVLVNQNFTNSQQLGNLSGYKLDTGNNGLGNWNITLSNQTRSFFNATLTDGFGRFSFTNIPWGIYELSEIPQAGWTQVTANRPVEINATSLKLENQNFTNSENPKSGNISGSKYNDLNGNGIKEINDVPIAGVIIKLYYQNGTLFGTQTTNANGIYVFDPVPPGSYILNETVQSGWQQTQPAGGNYGIEVNSTSRNFTKAFGNQLIPNPCSCPGRAYFTWSVAPSPAHTIKFTDASPGNVVYWLYDYGDGKFGIARSPSHTYLRAGTYTVKLSAQSCDCSGTKSWTYYSTKVAVP